MDTNVALEKEKYLKMLAEMKLIRKQPVHIQAEIKKW